MPIDRKQVLTLTDRLKVAMKEEANIKLWELVDAGSRIEGVMESLEKDIKAKIEEGNYSRSPPDICACLYFLASPHSLKSMHAPNIDLFSKVSKDLKFMQMENLRIEHLTYLMKAFLNISKEKKFLA